METEVKEHHLAKAARLKREAAEAAKNSATNENDIVVNDPETINQDKPQVDDDKIVVSKTELADLIAKEVAKNVQNIAPVQQVPVATILPQTNLNSVDDIPELRKWEYKDRIYVMCDDSKPASTGIRTKHSKLSSLEYFNPETRTPHALRLTSNFPSFFMEKQKDAEVILKRLFLTNGMLLLPKERVFDQKFLAIHPDNGIVWKELDKNAEAKKQIAHDDILFEAQSLARSISYATLEAVAMVFCRDVYNESWETDILKAEVNARILKDPARFISLAKDPTIKFKRIASLSLRRGYIRYEDYRFKDEKGVTFLEVARNEDEYEAISKYLTSSNGRPLADFLENSIN